MIEAAYVKLLDELHQESGEIIASALLSNDGIMLASQLPVRVSENKMAAMSAAMLSLGERMVSDLLNGITDRVMAHSNVGYVIVTAVSSEILLALIAQPDVRLGMMLHDIKEFAKKLQFLQYAVL